MKLSLEFYSNEVLEKLPQVKTSRIKDGKKFHPEGIFSEQIFGPLRDYVCHCKDIRGPKNDRCPECNIVLGPSSLRKKVFARIDLPVDVLSPQAYITFKSSVKLKNVYNKLMTGKGVLRLKGEDDFEIVNVNVKELQHETNDLIGLDALEEYVLRIASTKEGSENKFIQTLYELIQKGDFRTNKVLVLPPAYRPYNNEYMSEINKYYLSLLIMNEKRHKLTILNTALVGLEYQQVLEKLYDHIISKLSKKTGIFRHRIAGKRVDLSGRAVIIPDVIPYTHIKVPRLILMQMYKLEIAKQIVNRDKITFREAFELIDTWYDQKRIPKDIEQIIDNVTKDRVVLLNRQPTLHRGSIIAFKVIPSSGKSIGLSHLIVDPLNADFDGDAVAIYHLINEEEALTKMHVNAAFSAADGELQYYPKQDIIYSIYQITATEEGRKWLSEKLGVQITEQLDSTRLIRLLKDKFRENPTILEDVKNIGLNYTNEFPITLSIYDFLYTQDKIGKPNLTGNMQQDLQELKVYEEKLKEAFPKADIVKSGARASFTQITQMVGARGYVSDFFGNIIPYAIKSSYTDGLTEEEFFYSNYGTRKAVLDTALNVAESGYLTRRLVYAANSAVLDPTINDCMTTKTMKLYVKDIDMAHRLKGRFFYFIDPKEDVAAELLEVVNIEDIVGSHIYLRTPIHCSHKPYICKTCYGKLYDIHKSRFVGIIAAQTLGERSTQLTLRTFHTGGVAEVKDEDSDKQQDIVSSLKYVESLLDSKKKVVNEQTIYNMVMALYEVFKEYSSMHLIHIETIVSEKVYRRIDNDQWIKWRWTNQDDFEEVYLQSTKVIPSIQSPLLGAFFEKAKENLAKAVILKDHNDMSVLDKILLGIPID